MKIEVGDRITYKYKNYNAKYEEIVTSEIVKEAFFSRKNKDIEILKIEHPNYGIEEKKELLTEEEREFLKECIKFINIEINSINVIKIGSASREIHFNKNKDGSGLGYWYYIKDNYFKNLELGKIYTLKEVGLEE